MSPRSEPAIGLALATRSRTRKTASKSMENSKRTSRVLVVPPLVDSGSKCHQPDMLAPRTLFTSTEAMPTSSELIDILVELSNTLGADLAFPNSTPARTTLVCPIWNDSELS